MSKSTTRKPKETEPSGQMGGSGGAPRPEQGEDGPAPQPGTQPHPPTRYSDWASI